MLKRIYGAKKEDRIRNEYTRKLMCRQNVNIQRTSLKMISGTFSKGQKQPSWDELVGYKDKDN